MITNNVLRVRAVNTGIIRKIVKSHDGITKREVSQESGLSIATCSTLLNEMVATGEVIEGQFRSSGGGRAARIYYYNEKYALIAVISVLVGTKLTLDYCVSDSFGEVIENDTSEYDVITADKIENIIKKLEGQYDNIRSIAISVPGVIHKGIITDCDEKALIGTDLGALINKQNEEMKVLIESEPRAMLYGYCRENELKDGNIAIVTAPFSCLGSGFMVDGNLLRGSHGMAGEIQYLAEGNGNEISHAVRAIIAILNPRKVILCGESIRQGIEEQVRDDCAKHIPEEFLPEISYVEDSSEYMRKGLIALALENMETGVKLVRE